MTDRLVAALAEVIWVASRKDEGTISATGANIVARALIDHFGLVEETRDGGAPWFDTPHHCDAHPIRRLVSRWVEVEP
jgi:hypothetical protein